MPEDDRVERLMQEFDALELRIRMLIARIDAASEELYKVIVEIKKWREP